MNQLFTFQRFWLLLKLDFAENGKKYLIASSLIVGLLLLLMNPLTDLRKVGFNLLFMHAVGGWVWILGSSLFTSSVFASYHEPTKGIAALMVPASQMEKFLAKLLVNLLFVLFFLATFWAFHHGFVDLANSSQLEGAKYRYMPPNAVNFTNYGYFLIQASVFLGSIYFTRNAYIKTATVLLVVLALTFFLNLMIVLLFAPKASHVDTFPFAPWTIWVVNHSQPYPVTYAGEGDKLVWAFLILLIVGLWYTAYVRLKEKEI